MAGDLVGYGAYPNECIERTIELGALCVAGNHDLIALGDLSDERISAPARASLRWTSERLSESSRGFLRSLRGLRLSAEALGERDEAERCQAFLRELAPDAPEVVLPHGPAVP